MSARRTRRPRRAKPDVAVKMTAEILRVELPDAAFEQFGKLYAEQANVSAQVARLQSAYLDVSERLRMLEARTAPPQISIPPVPTVMLPSRPLDALDAQEDGA